MAAASGSVSSTAPAASGASGAPAPSAIAKADLEVSTVSTTASSDDEHGSSAIRQAGQTGQSEAFSWNPEAKAFTPIVVAPPIPYNTTSTSASSPSDKGCSKGSPSNTSGKGSSRDMALYPRQPGPVKSSNGSPVSCFQPVPVGVYPVMAYPMLPGGPKAQGYVYAFSPVQIPGPLAGLSMGGFQGKSYKQDPKGKGKGNKGQGRRKDSGGQLQQSLPPGELHTGPRNDTASLEKIASVEPMAAEQGAISSKDGGAREVEQAATEQPATRDPARKSWADMARAAASSSSAVTPRIMPKHRASPKAVGSVATVSDDVAANSASIPPVAPKADAVAAAKADPPPSPKPFAAAAPGDAAPSEGVAEQSPVVPTTVTTTAAPVALAKVSDTAAPSVTAQVAVPIAVPPAASASAAAATASEKRQEDGAASTSWAARLFSSRGPPPSPAKTAGAKAQSKECMQRPVTPKVQVQTPKASSAERPSPARAEVTSAEAKSPEKPPSQAEEFAAPSPSECRSADHSSPTPASVASGKAPSRPSHVEDRSPVVWPAARPDKAQAVLHAKVQQPKAALSTSRAPWAKARHQELPSELKDSEVVQPEATVEVAFAEDKKCEHSVVPELDAVDSSKPPAVSSKDVAELEEEADSNLDHAHEPRETPDDPGEKPERLLDTPDEPLEMLSEPLEPLDEPPETPCKSIETPRKVTRYTVELLRSLKHTPAATGPCPESIPGPMRLGDDSLATPTGMNGNRRQLYSKNSSKDLTAIDASPSDPADRDAWRSHRRQNSGRDKPRGSWRQESEALIASENSWAAGRQVRKQNEDENVPRAMKAILNKLTVEKFDTLFQKLLEVGISTRTHVEQLVREVFEKATTQHHFCEMYTDLCIKFNMWLSAQGMVDESGDEVVFRKILLNQCQDSFETYLKPPEGLDQLTGDEHFEAKMKYKTKMLGNMKLIGLLVCNKVMTSKVIPECILRLTSLKSEETLETLCTFLVSIGPVCDGPESKSKMILSDAFNQVKILSSDKEVPFRVRCKLKDVLDLRAAGWQKLRPSGAPEGPQSMAEVKSQWSKDHNVAVDRRTYTRGASGGDWETVPGSRRGAYGD